MNLINPPEVADGGYWHVVPVTSNPGENESGISLPGVSGWCSWADGNVAVIRVPTPLSGLSSASDSIKSSLGNVGYSGKPRARLGGV